MRIPGIYHLIWFSKDGERRSQPFPLTAFLTVASCVQVNQPAVIRFHCNDEPWGVWWELAKPYVDVLKMRAPARAGSIPLCYAAHQADVARLQILLEQGGIYLDLDVMSLRPFLPLQNESTVMGKEHGEGLCNAVILAERGAPFLRRWQDAYDTFDASGWNDYSVRLPARLAREHATEIRIMDERQFFWPMHWPQHLEAFFRKPASNFCRNSYCVHLWSTLSKTYLDELTPLLIWERESEFCRLARRFLGRELAYAGT